MKRVVITGSRHTKNHHLVLMKLYPYIAWVLTPGQHDSMRFLHGDCKTGADAIADTLLHDFDMGGLIDRYPADWQKYGRRAGPVRNHEMISACSVGDEVLAFPHTVEQSRGTENCIAEALRARLIIHIYPTSE